MGRHMDDYEIGYCKPPKMHQWKPGQSGNPNGRPRRQPDPLTIDDAEILLRLDAEEIVVNGQKMTRREAEIRRILASTLKGDRKARRLLNRLKKSIVKQRRGGVLNVPWDELERMQKR